MVSVRIGALDRKLLRDIWHLRGQVLAVTAVVMCGIAVFLTMRGMVESLVDTRDRYYAEYRFADVFANVKRAPESVAARIAAMPGVRAVSRRILFEGMLGNGHIQTVFVATAIDPQHEYQVCPRRRSQVAPGSAPLQPGGDHAADILIGQALADGLGETVGSTVFASSMT